jgi:hypothetical protein
LGCKQHESVRGMQYVGLRAVQGDGWDGLDVHCCAAIEWRFTVIMDGATIKHDAYDFPCLNMDVEFYSKRE